MVLFNYATKELTAKVVYYGPGLCGKTTNLQHIYDTLPNPAKGKMLSLATKTDRTLFFDFLPIDLGKIRGMKTKIQLYTVPGQVFYDTTRKLVLKGADGVVFVADSQRAMLEANTDSFQNLIVNLKEQNIDIENMPHVIQYNKRDMKNVLPVADLEKALNTYGVPSFEAIALSGEGVFETLKGISKLVLKNLSQKYGLEEEIAAQEDERPKSPSPPMPELPPNPGKPKASVPVQAVSPPKPEPIPAPKPEPIPVPDPVPTPAPAAQSFASPPKPAATDSIATQEVPEEPLFRDEVANPPSLDVSLDEIEFIEDEMGSFETPGEIDLDSFDGPDSEEIVDFDDDSLESVIEDDEPHPTDLTLDPISSLDNSEVVELDDQEPLEIEEMDEIAAIAKMAQNKPEELNAAKPQPIEVPISVNLPSSLAGKPLRLQIDIVFED